MRNAKLALGFAAMALWVGPVQAAPAPATAARPGLSASRPVDISADEAEVKNEQRLTIWRGNVEAIQGENRLRTPELTVYYAARQATAGQPAPAAGTGGFGAIERMEATGPVYFVTATQNAKGDHGVYLAGDDTITLTGNVVLVQDRNVVKGDKLVVNQKTGQSTLVSNASGRGSKDRVRGVFYPNQNQNGAAAPATPAPAAR